MQSFLSRLQLYNSMFVNSEIGCIVHLRVIQNFVRVMQRCGEICKGVLNAFKSNNHFSVINFKWEKL